MKKILIVALTAALLTGGLVVAAEKGDAKTELKDLVAKIQVKLRDGKKSEADMTEELKQFDVLLAAHKGEKTDDVAQIAFMKALLYLQVFDQTEKGVEMIKTLKKDFPDTTQGKKADDTLASIEKQEASKKIQRGLVEGATFPDFKEQDIDGKSFSIANYKGKVVLVDFWATWCGPCVAELPNVKKAYEAYHGKGFEIIGISLDQEKDKLTSFIKKENLPWQQYFDGLGWGSKLGTKYGVNSIPATYLLDGEGKIIAKNLRGPALEAALAKALK